MKLIDGLLAELEQEAVTTRRVLERIPQAHLSWKPHPKSMSLGQLALHVATVPGNVAELAAMDTIPEPPSFVQPEAATASELVPSLADSVAKAKRALGGFDDARMSAMWRLQKRRQGHYGHAPSRVRSSDHAEPLVSPSRPVTRLSAAAQSVGAVGLRSDRRRESVRGVKFSLACVVKSSFPIHAQAARNEMIKVINIESQARVPIAEGHVRKILGPSNEGTRVQVTIEEVSPGKACRLAPGDRTQVAYILEGKDAKVTHTTGGKTTEYTAQRRAGVYLEPGEEAIVTASGTPLVLLLVAVPKHTGKPTRQRLTDRLLFRRGAAQIAD